jgi:plasmid segregation protein ParM
MSISSQAETLRVIGTDDGHDTVKSCLGWDTATGFQYGYHKSRAVAGLEQVVSLGVNKASGAYTTEGQRFTIADGQGLLRSLDTRMDGYPVSDLNRTLVTHALADSGLSETPVYLVTGLPVDQYYKAGAPNTELIEAKKASLSKPVERIGAGPGLAQIVKQGVVAEAIAAFYDALIHPDGKFDSDIEKLISRRPVAVVDLGGKTLDIAVIAEKAQSVYNDRSGTANIGVLQLLDKVGERIKAEFQLNTNPPIAFVEEACRTKVYELFGEDKDVSHIVEPACSEYLAQVKNFFVSKAGDGADLGAVIFVGGGTALVRSVLGVDAFADVYKGRRLIPDRPEFANARGMWKFGMFLVTPADRQMPVAVVAQAGRRKTVETV